MPGHVMSETRYHLIIPVYSDLVLIDVLWKQMQAHFIIFMTVKFIDALLAKL